MNGLSFSWAVHGGFVLLGICVVLLLLVRWLLRQKDSGSPDNLAGVDGEVLDGYSQLMGKAKPEVGVSVLSADEFGFSHQVSEDQLGLLSDVQQEIREMCQLLSDTDGEKEDFFSMFALLREKYPRISGHPLRASLEHFIREQVPFFLSAAELDGLWD